MTTVEPAPNVGRRGALEVPQAVVGRQLNRIWTLLWINVLGFGAGSVIPVPHSVAQLITMGCLVMAFGLALRLNPMVSVRPNLYLLLLSILTVVAVVSSYRLEAGLGSLFRCLRLAVFVATLWLLSVWWRGDIRFVRFHVRAVGLVLTSVLLGALLAPTAAFSYRFSGVLWPIPTTQVGEYSAVAVGLVFLLWLTDQIGRREMLLVSIPGMVFLLLSHTRTALIGLLVALSVSSLTLALKSPRARWIIGLGASAAVIAALTLPEALQGWYQRDQSAEQLDSLTGRAKVWEPLMARERTTSDQLLGIGLTDKSFNGLPIDSTWLATYHELGFIGLGVVASILLGLLVTALVRPPSPARRLAIFLIVYCAVASYTECGLDDASPYLLHLAVAASLLVTSRSPKRGPQTLGNSAGFLTDDVSIR